ncbi:hypothetical protein [Kitasatospora purpeofusca]|uniref:hypothetical protein n=1 Tax=Kitasatospora purpeofusca TaxID=67352 RepID=UPI00381F489F
MDRQTTAFFPQMMTTQQASGSVYLPPAGAGQPLQQYVLTDAAGQQVLVTGAFQQQPQVVQPVLVQQQPAPGAAAGPVVPVWMVRAGFGVLLLVGGGFGLELLAGVLDHLVHVLGELVRLLVTLATVLAGGAVGLWVLKGALGSQRGGSAGGEGGGAPSVTTVQSVAVNVVNQIATGRRGRNHS